jgi:hypothetical protein
LLGWKYNVQINVGAVSPSELRAVSEKSLLLLAGTIADMEVILCYLLVISRARIEEKEVFLLCMYCSLENVPHL